jgi:hypothetical protein
MIYETVPPDRSICQGDIFRHVPRVDFSLASLPVVDGEQTHEQSWRDMEANAEVAAIMSVKSVAGIVITQDCDAQRSEYICLAQIDPFLAAIGQKDKTPKTPDRWQSLIVNQAKTNYRLFYLPVEATIAFNEAMVADFRIIVRVPRIDLENLKDQRVGTLNPTARAHFRESLSHYFRRYAYNEWYPLTKEQFEAYSAKCGEPVKAFPWQS